MPDLRRGCTAVCTEESGGCRQTLFFYAVLTLQIAAFSPELRD